MEGARMAVPSKLTLSDSKLEALLSDRIEIHSPGGPFGLVTAENFGRPGLTDYRNPHIAEAMKVLGYVQRFGVGIATAQKELAANGNPRAEFQVEARMVVAVLRR